MKKSLSLLCSCILLAGCGSPTEEAPAEGSESSASISVQAISSSTALDELPEGDFQLKNGMPEGTVYVKGYAEVEVVVEPFCEELECPEYDYVFFTVMDSGSKAFDDFLGLYGGNAFASDARIGLGCIEDDQISYENDSDEYGRKAFELDEDLSEKILAATAEAPITLTLTKLPLSGGAGAPACYAHFTNVEERGS